ncbi:hypothetical protein V8C26DRAFT_77270 [Trichoderma gracile]
MTHSQQSRQIPKFSSLGCWKHGHGYEPPLELNQTPAVILPFLCFFFCPYVISPNSFGCLPDTLFVVIISSYILATQSELRSHRLLPTEQRKERHPQDEKEKEKKANPPCFARPNKGNQPPGSGRAQDKVSVYGKEGRLGTVTSGARRRTVMARSTQWDGVGTRQGADSGTAAGVGTASWPASPTRLRLRFG